MKRQLVYAVIAIMLFGGYFIKSNKSYDIPTKARIDISEKTVNSRPCFEVREVSTKKLLSPVKWMSKFGSQGYVIQKEVISEELEITAISDKCKINFVLRGPWELKDKNNRSKGIKELWVEYTKFAINGQDIITKPTSAWHNKSIHHTITAQKGNVFYVKIGWRKIAE